MGKLISYMYFCRWRSDTNKTIFEGEEVQKLMLQYNLIYAGAMIASMVIPKKILSKAITGLIVFGMKTNVHV